MSKYIAFLEHLALLEREYLRRGQYIMNRLYFFDKATYDMLHCNEFDCFYDDGLISKTLNELKRIWTCEESLSSQS